MAWSLIASASNGSPDTINVTAPAPSGTINTTGADLIVAVVCHYTANPAASDLTDSASNSYSLQASQASGSDAQAKVAVFYKLNPTTSASHTFTFSRGGAVTSPSIVVYAFSGLAGSPTVSSVGSGTGSTNIQPGSIGVSDDLVVSGIGWYANNTMSIDSGFTSPIEVGYVAGSMGVAGSWKSVSGAENPTWSLSGSNSVAGINASFTGTGGGGGGGGSHDMLLLSGVG
jgi:hypothetical protein